MNTFFVSMLRPFVPAVRYVWRRLPERLLRTPAMKALGFFLYEHYVRDTERNQTHYTWFVRNRPQLEVLCELMSRHPAGATVRIASIGCSVGAELYSALWLLRSARPDLRFEAVGIDVSETVVAIARKATYRLNMPASIGGYLELDGAKMLTTEPDAIADMMEMTADGAYRVKSWIREGVDWMVGDATAPSLPDLIGPQDVVLACNFLGPMDDPLAERCLRNVVRLLAPGGHLVLDGVDLDVKARTAEALNLLPVTQRVQEVHRADPTKGDWPWTRWSHEPFDGLRCDWAYRYATVFIAPAQEGARRPVPSFVPKASPAAEVMRVGAVWL